MNTARSTDSLLDPMQYEADPLADRTMAAILGPWQVPAEASAAELIEANELRWQRLAAVNRLFAHWKDNRSITDWQAAPDTPPEVAGPIAAYLRVAGSLPEWADEAKIARAGDLFTDHGVMSCMLLFCASLPECYVIPDLSQALHVTGQLEQHTEYRIRATAAMIFPVMMPGGLTAADGGGLAQVLKVRLIHATIRNLILRGNPEAAAQLAAGAERAGDVQPLAALRGARTMHQALFAHGWNVARDGLPCNQEELAYTLMTFHYVFLRGMQKLGLGLSRADELAYLHAWNVVGHVLGVHEALMAHTMEDAKALFARMQARGRAQQFSPDPRPHLGSALMRTMEDVVPLRFAKPIPRLLTRHLCGRETARDIGIAGTVPWVSRLLFVLLLVVVKSADLLLRMLWREARIARFLSRVITRRFMAKVLMDQTRPLKLPEHVTGQVQTMLDGWSDDPKAPKWVNRLEQKLMPQGPAAAAATSS